jgi:polynucleotide 5'-hydroxyl-kinase GRC3/NOL9
MEIPKDWRNEMDRASSEKGTIIVLGGADTGKTTFVKFLADELSQKGLKVAVIDSDMGQSAIGPPTTIGMVFYPERDKEYFYFVGSISPMGHLLPTAVGVKKLTDRAKAMGAEVIIVDTTGYVSGEGAQQLKHSKIELLRPNLIIALDRENEIGSLIAPYLTNSFVKIDKLSVPQAVHSKTMKFRREYREKKFRKYFKGSKVYELSARDVGIFGSWIFRGRILFPDERNTLASILETNVTYGEDNGDAINVIVSGFYNVGKLYQARQQFSLKRVNPWEKDFFEHILVGLYDELLTTIALGTIDDVDFINRNIKIITPLQDITKVKGVCFGSLKVSPGGRELGKLF